MKTLSTFMTGLAVSGSAFAADVVPANTSVVDALTLVENVGVYAKKDSASTVAALNSTIAAEAFGLDWRYEILVYWKRWGSWLGE